MYLSKFFSNDSNVYNVNEKNKLYENYEWY